MQSKEVQSFGSFFALVFFFETAVHFPILAPDFSSYFFGAASFVEFPDLLTCAQLLAVALSSILLVIGVPETASSVVKLKSLAADPSGHPREVQPSLFFSARDPGFET